MCICGMGEEERKILEPLLVDELETLRELVEKIGKFLRINKHTGDAVILVSQDVLSQKDLIALHIVARYFAFKLGLTSSDSITIEELKRKTGIHNDKLIAARTSELRKEGVIEVVKKGAYRISLPNLIKYLDQLGEKYGK